MGTPITKRIQNSRKPTYTGGMEISVSANGSGKAVPKQNPSPAKQKRTIEGKVNDALGNPKGKARSNSEQRYGGDSDSARHTTSAQYTTEAIRNKMPLGLGNSLGGRILAGGISNVLGAAHEAKGAYGQIKGGRPIKEVIKESAEDMTNNLAGSLIGAYGNSKMDKSKNKLIDRAVKLLPDGLVEDTSKKKSKKK